MSTTTTAQVYRKPYYDACVRDSCGCDTGGDCECMCDAIAVYAKACLDVGICIDWRAPDFCRKFLVIFLSILEFFICNLMSIMAQSHPWIVLEMCNPIRSLPTCNVASVP